MDADHEFDCPGCGEPTPTLHEGYCEDCRRERQSRRDLHNAQYDQWQKMSAAEREAAIKRAVR